jgi:cell division transport system permease protein
MRAGWCCTKGGSMSTTDTTLTGEQERRPARGPERAADAPLAGAPVSRVETPIVPQSTISGHALVSVVAIMTFLAGLTTGAVMMVRSAASEWQSEVAREVTIQVRPAGGRDLEADVAKAAALARATPGVSEVKPYSKDEATRLLEPWLGSGLKLDDLPVPRIIVVRIAAGAAPDLAQLRATLTDEVPPASLDDHRGFVDRMRAMVGAALAIGIGVLGLVLAATVLTVTFATRAAMATNRPVIEVLHLIGAKDAFISGHFQRHFLALGLKGGFVGGGAAVALFALVDLASRWLAGRLGGGELAALFGSYSIGVVGYLAMLAQVALVAGVTALTSRHTVNRTIETMH